MRSLLLLTLLLPASLGTPSPDPCLGFAQPHLQVGIAKRTPEIQGLATVINSTLLAQVQAAMEKICTLSWENGTKAQALIEYTAPVYSPFNVNASLSSTLKSLPGLPGNLLSIAQVTLANRPICFASSCGAAASNTTQNGTTLQTAYGLLADSAAGDPASLGTVVVLAGIQDSSTFISNTTYPVAAQKEVEYLLNVVPRTSTGAISHRADQPQLWADFVYMVPPFLAFYGLQTSNQTLLQIAYDQCRLYRQGLQDSNTKLWHHILLGTVNYDPGLWGTGNAWAAAGMMRVLATILQSDFSDAMSSQRSDLQSWVDEIITASASRVAKNGLIYNYINDTSTFTDSASSALMASAAYRMATLKLTTSHIQFANQIHSTIASKYINSTGYLTGAVNPLNFGVQLASGGSTPEGQAFVLLMESGYRDYIAAGGSDDTTMQASGARRTTGTLGWAMESQAVLLGLTTFLGLIFSLQI